MCWKEGRKDGRKEGRKEGRKGGREGGKGGRKGGRKEGRKEGKGRKEKEGGYLRGCCVRKMLDQEDVLVLGLVHPMNGPSLSSLRHWHPLERIEHAPKCSSSFEDPCITFCKTLLLPRRQGNPVPFGNMFEAQRHIVWSLIENGFVNHGF